MSELIVRMEPDRGVRVIHDHVSAQNKLLLSMDEVHVLWEALDGILHGLVCPPDCCGRQMEPIRLVIDKRRRDCWRCPVCGELRTRRV